MSAPPGAEEYDDGAAPPITEAPPWVHEHEDLDDSLPPPSTYKLNGNGRHPPEGDDAEHSTWWPTNLASLFDDTHEPPRPELFARDDDQPLLYRGKCHAFNGESESGKSWAALIACVQAARAGEHVLYLDFEDTAETVVTRLLALGAKPADVLARFHYSSPNEPLRLRSGQFTRGATDLATVLEAWPVTLAVIDGVTEAMNLHGLDPLGNVDYATFHAMLPRRLALEGIAVAQIDHVTKDRENRGRYAIGAQHKLAAMDGAVYTFTAVAPFGIGRHGIAHISVEKDRPGQIRQHAKGKRIADLHLESDPETHALAWRVEAPSGADGAGGDDFKPTIYMERVSRFLEQNPQGMSKSSIRTGVKGGSDHIDLALELLIGTWVRVDRAGNRSLHVSVKPYREGETT